MRLRDPWAGIAHTHIGCSDWECQLWLDDRVWHLLTLSSILPFPLALSCSLLCCKHLIYLFVYCCSHCECIHSYCHWFIGCQYVFPFIAIASYDIAFSSEDKLFTLATFSLYWTVVWPKCGSWIIFSNDIALLLEDGLFTLAAPGLIVNRHLTSVGSWGHLLIRCSFLIRGTELCCLLRFFRSKVISCLVKTFLSPSINFFCEHWYSHYLIIIFCIYLRSRIDGHRSSPI